MYPLEKVTFFNEIIKEAEEIRRKEKIDLRDEIVSTLYSYAEDVERNTVIKRKERNTYWDKKIDDLVTSKWLGFPIMLFILSIIFWLTIIGANYPSKLLSSLFFSGEKVLSETLVFLQFPLWIHNLLVFGVYRSLSWVISVMLPPMAIFFPCFTLLEDFGYLPRVAFNLDRFFKKVGAHGKQALTMSMGFGCNAAAIVSCRIIESPRERIIAILTNNFVPCNGRFPLLISLSTILIGGFIGKTSNSFLASLIVIVFVVFGVIITWGVSFGLSKTILKGEASTFALELPSYRKPQIGKVIIRSILDRTLYVLGRAICTAAPAGAIIWIMANINIGNASLLSGMANILNPFGQWIGLDGYILVAFILGFPANEIVLPILIMGYMSKGALVEIDNLESLKSLLLQNGWTSLTALNMMIFSLLHFPCGTTIWTIKKETKSNRWTFASILIPTIIAILVCFITTTISKFFGWI